MIQLQSRGTDNHADQRDGSAPRQRARGGFNRCGSWWLVATSAAIDRSGRSRRAPHPPQPSPKAAASPPALPTRVKGVCDARAPWHVVARGTRHDGRAVASPSLPHISLAPEAQGRAARSSCGETGPWLATARRCRAKRTQRMGEGGYISVIDRQHRRRGGCSLRMPPGTQGNRAAMFTSTREVNTRFVQLFSCSYHLILISNRLYDRLFQL